MISFIKLNCVICGDLLERKKDPAMLNCLHGICRDCVRKKNAKYGLRCPSCKEFTRYDGYAYPIELRKMCTNGNCKNGASNYCVPCNKIMCFPCINKHGKYHKDNPDYFKLIPFEHSKVLRTCPKHDDPLNKYCVDCGYVVCGVCCQRNHTEHLVRHAYSEMKDMLKQFLVDCSTELRQYLPLIDQRISVLENCESNLFLQRQVATDKMDTSMFLLHPEMTKRAHELKKMTEECFRKCVDLNCLNKRPFRSLKIDYLRNMSFIDFILNSPKCTLINYYGIAKHTVNRTCNLIKECSQSVCREVNLNFTTTGIPATNFTQSSSLKTLIDVEPKLKVIPCRIGYNIGVNNT